MPVTDEQRARVARILRAAARHGAAHGLERVQMARVAAEAEVALATLYRYFPSKAALFVGVLRAQVDQAAAEVRPERPGDPGGDVAELLVELGAELLARPLLAHAMLASNNHLVSEPGAAVTDSFTGLLLRRAGVETPTERQRRLVRIVERAWYGIVISALNGATTRQDAEEDTRLLCRLVLADLNPV